MSVDSNALNPAPPSLQRKRTSASLDLLRRLFRTRFGGIGLVILAAITFLSVFAPLFATTGPLELEIGRAHV